MLHEQRTSILGNAITARRLLRAVLRPLKRITRAWRLKHAEYLIKHSEHELARLADLRKSLVELEANEHRYQVHLSMRRQQLQRGMP